MFYLFPGQVFLCSETFTDGVATIKGTGLGENAQKEIMPTTKPPVSRTITDEESFKCSERDPTGEPVVRAGQTLPNFKPNTGRALRKIRPVLT